MFYVVLNLSITEILLKMSIKVKLNLYNVLSNTTRNPTHGDVKIRVNVGELELFENVTSRSDVTFQFRSARVAVL